jgi:flagella basal body P-ring formation protein FlgA
MRSLIRLCPWALAVTLGLCPLAGAVPPAAAAPDESPVVVTLRPSAGVAASPVCVGHVASLSGGTPALREQIAGLDLADRPRRGKPLSLPREMIAYRLQVAGIDRGRFRVQGAAAVQVSPDVPVTEDDFLQAARDALLDKLPWRADDLMMALAQSPPVPQLSLGEKDEVRLDAEPREPISAPGRIRVDVTLLVNGERLGLVPVLVDVSVYQMVAVAARRIEGGEPLGEENVRFERHATDAAGNGLTAKDLAPGRKARRPIAAGQMIPVAAVEPLNADSPILVRQRDLVKMVARVGNLRVTALAEAEQDGRAGDRIRVHNVDSKKEIVGRVVGRGLVEVEY